MRKRMRRGRGSRARRRPTQAPAHRGDTQRGQAWRRPVSVSAVARPVRPTEPPGEEAGAAPARGTRGTTRGTGPTMGRATLATCGATPPARRGSSRVGVAGGGPLRGDRTNMLLRHELPPHPFHGGIVGWGRGTDRCYVLVLQVLTVFFCCHLRLLTGQDDPAVWGPGVGVLEPSKRTYRCKAREVLIGPAEIIVGVGFVSKIGFSCSCLGGQMD